MNNMSDTTRGKTSAASTPGSFAPHERSEGEVQLLDRATRVQLAEQLYGEIAKLRDAGEKARLEQVQSELFRRENRASAPLTELSMQARSRTVYSYLVQEGNDDLLDLDPPYQRGDVWTTQQRVALIESLLRGIPVGTIIVNNRGFDTAKPYAVIDGRQRIQTLRAFQRDEFTVPADWFEDQDIASEDDSRVSHSNLTLRGQRGFSLLPMPELEASVRTLEDEARIFLLINAAGTAQDPETLERAAQMTTPR